MQAKDACTCVSHSSTTTGNHGRRSARRRSPGRGIPSEWQRALRWCDWQLRSACCHFRSKYRCLASVAWTEARTSHAVVGVVLLQSTVGDIVASCEDSVRCVRFCRLQIVSTACRSFLPLAERFYRLQCVSAACRAVRHVRSKICGPCGQSVAPRPSSSSREPHACQPPGASPAGNVVGSTAARIEAGQRAICHHVNHGVAICKV